MDHTRKKYAGFEFESSQKKVHPDQRLYVVSNEFADFFGLKRLQIVCFSDMKRLLMDYIQRNNLRSPVDPRFFVCDYDLFFLFRPDTHGMMANNMTYLNFYVLLRDHYVGIREKFIQEYRFKIMCFKYKNHFKRWLYERVRLPKVQAKYHPDRLCSILKDIGDGDRDDDDEFFDKIEKAW